MKHKKLFWFKQMLCLLLALLLISLTAVPSINASSLESESENTTETSSESTTAPESTESPIQDEESEEPSAQNEEAENITYANSISGMLWLDANNDGIHDAGEQPVVGYSVYLYVENDTDNVVQIAETAADGTYSLTNITPGSYVVGVTSATVCGQEYLLPFVGIKNDNKFVIEWDNGNAYSEAISVGEDSTVIGIDAGMRTSPKGQTMEYPYTVTDNASNTSHSQPNLSGVKWSIEYFATTSDLGYGKSYTITVQSNVSAEPEVLTLTDLSGLDITITSAAPYTITFSPEQKHDWAFNMGSNNLTMTNIILNGNGWNSDIGGISMSGGTLTMNSGSTITNFLRCSAVSLNGSTFNMNDGTIAYNRASNGGGVYLNGGSTFTMKGGSINHNLAYVYGGGVYITGNSKFIMNTGEINNNTADGNGAGIYCNNTAFTMNGGTISNNGPNPESVNPWVSGGGVCVEGGSFRMTGGIISNNTAIYSGGGVFLKDTTSSSMEGGSIGVSDWGNKVTKGSGGGVYLEDSAFNMSEGTISYNEAYNGGGGVATGKDGTFNMTGGTISNNEALNGGGAFITSSSWVNAEVGNVFEISTFSISGTATIKKNVASDSGGGVYLMGDGNFEMKDGLIDDNEANSGSGGGVYVYYKDLYTPAGGTFALSDGIISNNKALSDEDSKGGGIAFFVELDHAFTIPASLTGGIIGDDDGNTNGNEASIGGGISVMNGSTVKEVKVTLNVNGTKIKGNSAIAIASYEADGTPHNDVGDGGGIGIVNNYRWNDSGELEQGTSQIIIEEGTIAKNEAAKEKDGNGGGVWCDAGTSFVMEGGLIDGNKASSGGGVYFPSGSETLFEMNKGTISRNVSYWEGGGLYIGAGNDATIAGSATEITGNMARYHGGGISFQGGNAKLTITEAKISENEITKNWKDGGGGGLHCSGTGDGNCPIIELKNVEITGNWNSEEPEEDEEVIKNTFGGGIYMQGTGKLTVSSDSKINNNTEMNQGGGIYIGKSVVAEITDSTIDGNKVTGNGGGIYIDVGGIVNIKKGTIINNEAPEGNGGGINIEDAPNYGNLAIDEDTEFNNNIAQAAFQPPDDVRNNSRCKTIENESYSEELIFSKFELAIDPPSPLNNCDINLVLYRIRLTLVDPADWRVLGNIAVTFTNFDIISGTTKTQTAIFSKSIGEYRGYPDPKSIETGSPDNGIEILSYGTWDVMLDLPNNYDYQVLLNDKSYNKRLTIDETSAKYIEIEVTKKDPPWGKWIYKFN